MIREIDLYPPQGAATHRASPAARRRAPRAASVFAALALAGLAQAAPMISMNTEEDVVLIPVGTVSTSVLAVANCGDSNLTWTLTDRIAGRVIRDFANPWTSARSLRYDATRDCLWLSYYYSSDVKKVGTLDGTILETKSMGTACRYPYAIETEAGFLWAADYSGTRFVKFDLDTMAEAATKPFPTGWAYAYGFGINNGQWYATHNGDMNDICRLNPASGAVEKTFDEIETYDYRSNHICARGGGVWWGAYNPPKNEIRKLDPALGRVRRAIEMPEWYASGSIYDQSFAGSDERIWALTYQHDYHVSGQSKYRIHLLDVSALPRLRESADGGMLPAAESADVNVVFDARGASSAVHRVRIAVDSDGGAAVKPYVFVVHAPGTNAAPSANAGPDQALDPAGAKTPVTLDGSASSDPNGDFLIHTWTENGTEVATGARPTLSLSPGVHDITLTVDDYRGGTDVDTVRITVHGANIAVDDLYVPQPQGGGIAGGTVTVRNTGDRALDWTVVETILLGQADIVREFKVAWKSTYSSSAFPTTLAYDATRDCLWAAYYYDDEVGKLNATSGATIETKVLGSTHRCNALDMEGADLWVADYNALRFKRFDLGAITNTQTISKPAAWTYGPTALARDAGLFFAAQNGRSDLCRLDPASGEVLNTFPAGASFSTYPRMDAIGGTIWYGTGTAPRNEVRCMDGATGTILKGARLDHWPTDCQIYDLSFAATNTRCWMLTSGVKSGDRWAHLVNLSRLKTFSKTAGSGSTPSGAATAFDVRLDTAGLALGWYPIILRFTSNDPDLPVLEKRIVFFVHRAGPNQAPNADAGPDVVREIPGATAPFVLDLSAGASSDPDGDTLLSSWTMNGGPVRMTDKGLIELGEGVYTFELTVDDLRGGTDSDTRTVTVRANTPLRDWTAWHGSAGTGHACETNENWLQNWPPVVVWRRPEIKAGGYGGNSCPVVSEGRVYYSGKWCVDALTGQILWQNSSFSVGNPTTAVDEDRIYAGTKRGEASSKGRLACFDKRTGAQLWISGDIGPGGDADGSGEWLSPTVHGDLVLYGQHGLNKYTGATVWSCGSSTVHWKRFDWGGRTLLLNGSGYLRDPLTGAQIMRAGYAVSNAEGWYPNCVTHGTNRIWTIGKLYEVGGRLLTDYGNPGSVTYTQPFTIGEQGFFVAGGHGCGGPFNCVDLKTGRKWTLDRIGSAIAIGDRALAHANEGVFLYTRTAEAPTLQSYRYDPVGANGFTEVAYAGQRIYVMASQGLTCLYTGYAAPVVNNGVGAVWDETSRTATLNGVLVNTGGKPTQVSIYWGRNDGGTNAASWERREDLGPRVAGQFAATVSPLADTVYYYRCFASNEIGGAWASLSGGIRQLEPSKRFATYSSGSRLNDGSLLLHWTLDATNAPAVTTFKGRFMDASGNGNHGDLLYGQLTDGAIGGAARAILTQYYGLQLQVSCTALSEPLNGDFSMAFWINFLTNYPSSGGGSDFLYWGVVADGRQLAMGMAADGAHFRLAGAVSPVGVVTGQWHHVAMTREGADCVLYLDGVPVIGPVGGHADPFASLSIAIPTDVKLDDLRVYRRPLSLEEIRGLGAMAGPDGATPATGRVAAGSDDAEQRQGDGAVYLDRPHLALARGAAGDGDQKVGLRFSGLNIPRGASIHSAAIQFQSQCAVSLADVRPAAGARVSYGTLDTAANAPVVADGGRTVTLTGNQWKAYPFPYSITANTMLDFLYRSTAQGDVQGIGFDNQTATTKGGRILALYGTNTISGLIATYRNYGGSAPGLKRYSLPIGTKYTGAMTHVVFANADTTAPLDAVSEFRDIRLYEKPAAAQTEATCLTIRGEAADNAATFTAAANDIGARPLTRATVEWRPPAWNATDAGISQQTPDLSGLLQELVLRRGWTASSAAAFVIEGTGQRVALAGESPLGTSACLRVTWRLPEPLRVLSAVCVGNPNEVLVTFDRPVSPATAETAGNYRLNGAVPVVSAQCAGDGSVVRLTTGRLATGQTYRLTVDGVTDLSVPPQRVAMDVESLFECLAAPVQFVRADRTTQGSWRGVYGSDACHRIVYSTTAYYPPYAACAATGTSFLNWNYTGTPDPRALQNFAGTSRTIGAWRNSSGTSFSVDVNVTDGAVHQLALYCLDWDSLGRTQKVEIVDHASGRVWDSRSLGAGTGLTNGVWLVWNLTGRQIVRLTSLAAGKNAVLSAICFDPPARLPGPDENGNGIEDAWELRHYSTMEHPAQWFRSADSDGDGLNDWAEFVAGTLPFDGGSYLSVADTAHEGAGAVVLAWPSEAGRAYDVWSSTNLAFGFDARAAADLPATPPMNVHTVLTDNAASVFYRIEVK